MIGTPPQWKYLNLQPELFTLRMLNSWLKPFFARTNNPSSNQNNFSGLAIGLVIVAGGHAAGPISGASLNPAAAIGLEVGGDDGAEAFGLAYAFIQLLAGFLGAACYRLARKHEYLELCGEPSTASKLFCELFGTLLLCTTVAGRFQRFMIFNFQP